MLRRGICSSVRSPFLVRRLFGYRDSDALLVFPVADGGLDRIFGKHRAVNFDWRKRKLADDVRILDGQRLFDGLALYPFGSQRRAGNRGAAAKRLKAGFLDNLPIRI